MRVQTEEWQRFIPGVRMYKGKKSLFYNGEKLWDDENEEWLIYSEEEQHSWEVVIILPGVRRIRESTFSTLEKLETVIMADDSVETIEASAFYVCRSLEFVKLSRNLEYIGEYAFYRCSLTSIFIPPSCREIGNKAFQYCQKLIIFHVPRHTLIGIKAIMQTELLEASPFEVEASYNYEEVNEWVKGINDDDEYELHRACSSFNPLMDIIYGVVKRKGLNSWKLKNEIGITPFDYLEANPFAENNIDQRALMKRYLLEMIGETM
ncbi:hypothetical protein CTEN210_06769 [Chaetoceros tenuissimus]|uniref:Leucine-rich repeat domain-containing protein n=1 Tax=Chaetoceros tenuissimus TaxID=426638 RepID=A0AAD3CR15_9STRA|nr:hypothetical protein CTEN210_06769 [Chaetoceros tenuissimus]